MEVLLLLQIELESTCTRHRGQIVAICHCCGLSMRLGLLARMVSLDYVEVSSLNILHLAVLG